MGERTLVAGIVNVTPDSFSDGGKFSAAENAINRTLEIQEAGADIIEIGAESTRPGAEPVTVDDELRRIIPVLEGLSGKLRVPISVDTYKSEVARRAVDLGASIINDVSALRFDPKMAETAAEAQAGLILMHMRDTPSTMQKIPLSEDILSEIESDLRAAVESAQSAGVARESIILDPGVGFGKTLDQDLEIVNGIERLSKMGFPLMIGTSRKKFIGRLIGRLEADRVFGTAATVAAAVLRGAHIVRVHDVEQMIDVVRVADAILANKQGS